MFRDECLNQNWFTDLADARECAVTENTMKMLTDSSLLENGVRIPKLGFGTWQIPDGKKAYDAVAAALEVGYRHIDTARAYGNESSVARAIADSGIPRGDVFVTTKLPAEVKVYGEAVRSFEETLAALGMDHVDLYLIHAPWPWEEMGKDCRSGNAEVWRAMEEMYEQGRARAIGVSNFEVADIESLVSAARLKPQVNQIRLFAGNPQNEVTAYCRRQGILVEGYSPLATGSLIGNKGVRRLADKYEKSVAQLCIRYVAQKGALPLPKTTSKARMIENADVDFEIAEEDIACLDGLQGAPRATAASDL